MSEHDETFGADGAEVEFDERAVATPEVVYEGDAVTDEELNAVLEPAVASGSTAPVATGRCLND